MQVIHLKHKRRNPFRRLTLDLTVTAAHLATYNGVCYSLLSPEKSTYNKVSCQRQQGPRATSLSKQEVVQYRGFVAPLACRAGSGDHRCLDKLAAHARPGFGEAAAALVADLLLEVAQLLFLAQLLQSCLAVGRPGGRVALSHHLHKITLSSEFVNRSQVIIPIPRAPKK